MQIRAKSVIKLQSNQSNIDYTFVAGTPIEKVIEALLINVGISDGKEAVIALAGRVAERVKVSACGDCGVVHAQKH